ncbi:MAG: hypothetical protein GY715_09125 [Planctomycetes bacterium]|nr:hypothetical protein [Planctomycetota bacterium]
MRRAAIVILGALTVLWILWTLYPVARYGGAVVVDPSTTSRIMGTRVGDEVHSAVGLTYTGIGGAMLVIVELLLVGAALVVSLRRPITARRAGLVVLVLWTGLWLGNALWMERLAGGQHVTGTIPVMVALLVVLGWAAVRWRRGPGAPVTGRSG